MRHKITRWLERLNDDCTSLVLRAGDTRQSESIIEKWQVPFDDVDDIIDTVEETMQEEFTGRLIAYNERAKQLRSLSVRGIPDAAQQTASETGMLIEGILRMAEEQRRFVATITDSFQTMHETIQDALHVEREHHEEMADAQLALALAQVDNETQKESTIDKALEMVAHAMQNGKTSSLRDTIINNPAIIDDFLNDEEIVQIITNRMMNGTDKD